ncbi:MAG: hypothetical protein ACKN9V_02985, partial [Pseudomonadota bacterium]
MKHQALFSLSIVFITTSGFAIEDHKAKEVAPFKRETVQLEQKTEDLLATLGEDTSPSGYRKLFIYSSEKLSEVEYQVGAADNWNQMVKAKSPTHEAFGTDSYLPSAPGQKYTVRGIGADGTRVTTLLEIDPKDGRVILTKVIKEESKEEVDAERKAKNLKQAPSSQSNFASDNFSQSFGSSAVLMRAQGNLGRCLGNGTCAALAGGDRVGQLSGGSGYQQVQPGQVLRFSPGSSFSSSMGRFNVSSQGHYVVVESVNPDGSFTFLHQNWAGGSREGQTV